MARWQSCNVLQVGADTRRIWQFDARSRKLPLHREQSFPPGEPLPPKMVGKSWNMLWQPRLNVAWLPPDKVFIRVAQFPMSSFEETRAMVELQLEKLSPLPVAQAVWTMQVFPSRNEPPPSGQAAPGGKDSGSKAGTEAVAAASMQTVVITIASRNAVEEFLGQLEGQGYLADRLELPLLDQLQATQIKGNGAWIYPEGGGRGTALVAWWYGGVLQNLDLLMLSAGTDRAKTLRDQLTQMAWGGELEGWLTSSPQWHLVAEGDTAKEWVPLLREGLEQPVEVIAPLPPLELAALTAKRATQADPKAGLLPPEFATRYRQQLVDRLWGRGLLAMLVLYGIGLAIYFSAVTFLNFKVGSVEKKVASLSQTYTNAMQLRARYNILKERQQLKYAALDCWEVTAELMPEGLTLDSLNFSDGKKLTLNGTAPASQLLTVSDFSSKLRKAVLRGKPLFDPAKGEPLSTHVNPGKATMSWSFGLQLQRSETVPE